MSSLLSQRGTTVRAGHSIGAFVREQSSLPQPTLLILLGKLGSLIKDELQRRTTIYQRFHSAHGAVLEQSVELLHLPHDLERADPDQPLQLHTDDDIRSVAYEIRRRYTLLRARQKSETDVVRPNIVVIGACWEPDGAALWPLAAVIRAVLEPLVNYTLIGVFLTAQWTAEETEEDRRFVIEGDARSCTVLEQGDQQLNAQPTAADQICQALGVKPEEPERLLMFDWTYLIDSERADGSTVRANNNSYETELQIVTLIEVLVYGRLNRVIDQTLLDDYAAISSQTHSGRPRQQVYLSVGFASLTVPLREIGENAARRIAAELIRERTLSDYQPQLADQLRMNDLLAAFEREITESYYQQLTQALKVNSDYRLDSGHRGRYRVQLALDGTTIRVRSFRLMAEPIASESDSLRAQDVQHRLDDEAAVGYRYVQQAVEVPSVDLKPFDQRVGSLIAEMLESGDHGLQRAAAQLEYLIAQLGRAVESARTVQRKAAEQVRQIEEHDGTIARVWFVDRRLILDSALRLRGRFAAIVVRTLALVVLLQQFYYDGLLLGVPIWPTLEVWPALETYDLVLLNPLMGWVIVALLILVLPLAVLPPLAIFLHVAAVRQQRRRVLTARLLERVAAAQLRMREDAFQQLTERRQPVLQQQIAALRTYADQTENAARAVPTQSPLQNEFWIVNPAEYAHLQRIKNSEQLRALIGSRLIPSWLSRPTGSGWDLLPVRSLTNAVEHQVRRFVDFDTMRPIRTLLTPQLLGEALPWLDRAAVPWASYVTPVFSLHDDRSHQLHELSLLVTDAPQSLSALPQFYDWYRASTWLGWLDQYRVTALRVVCGITTANFARMAHLRSQQAIAQRMSSSAAQAAPLSVPQQLMSELAPLVDAVADPAVRTGFERAAAPLQHLLLTEPDPPAADLVQSLAELDRLRESAVLPQSALVAMNRWYLALDRWLDERGITPVTPPIGVPYDPRHHGVAQAVVAPDWPAQMIVRRLRRGYRSAGRLLVEPEVEVSVP